MNHLTKFHAISAVYFGLASAIGAHAAAPGPEAAGSPAVERPRQDRFEHPMLEQHPSTDLRQDGQRIQRRGLDGARQDGEIRRNIAPDATQADESLAPPGSPEQPGRDRHKTDRQMPESQ